MPALAAGLLFFLHQRKQTNALRWHGVMWLPLGLMAYALGSMVWSHTYLGGVEAIHWGAVVASIWTALQS